MTFKNEQIKIVAYKNSYKEYFKELNLAWLEKYFYVEDHDREVLNNAKSYIIDNGGFIFFALYKNQVAGTVALINEPEGYELSKMAVDPKYQGKKIGQLLMLHCIEFAKNKAWSKLILYSSTKLENALHIYRKYGFKEVELEKDSPYQRGDIKMVLKL